MQRIRRALVAGLGLVAFGLGWLGVFLPGLPTTIFWIIAAAAFLRTNPRLYAFVVSRPRFGPAVRLFVEEGRIARKGKLVSVAAMLGFAGLGAFLAPPLWAKLLVLGSALAGSAWVASLPLVEDGAAPDGERRATAGPGALPGAAREAERDSEGAGISAAS